MSKRIIACVLPCLMLWMGLCAFGQGGGRGAAAPLPDNPQSLAHIDVAKKIANGDPVLMNPWNFF